MHDVFISYKAEELTEAQWVKSTLEASGISCWMAPECIAGGSSYAVEIPKAIKQAKIFVLVLSSKAQASPWVSREVDLALNERKTVLPFMLENCPLKDDFYFYLTNVQRYPAYEDKAAAMEKMLHDVRATLNIEASSESPEIAAEPASPISVISEEAFSSTLDELMGSNKKSWPSKRAPKNTEEKPSPAPVKTQKKPSRRITTEPTAAPVSAAEAPFSALATIALVMGILSAITAGSLFPINFAAKILALIAAKRIAKKGYRGKKRALTGMLLSWLATVSMFVIYYVSHINIIGLLFFVAVAMIPTIFFFISYRKLPPEPPKN